MASISMANQSKWLEKHSSLGISLIDHLWNRMDGAYPNRWRSAFSGEQAIENWKHEWVSAFDEENITPNDVAVGIRSCRKQYDWPPSLSEFLKACKPMLDHETAYYEAVEQMQRRKEKRDVWSSKAIYWAAQAIGEFDLRSLPWAAIKTRWSKALSEMVAEDNLPDIPEYAKELPPPGKRSLTQSEAQERIKTLMPELSADAKKDHKAWARRVIANPNDYPAISLKMATEALGG